MPTRNSKIHRVLIVEDDVSLRELLRDPLSLIGFSVEEVDDGRDTLQRARSVEYQLIILDLMLPYLDAITLCRTIRTTDVNRDTPILILTVRDTESDTVLGLESGADDYLTKPFSVRELLARVAAILQRSRIGVEPEPGNHLRAISIRGLSNRPS